MKNNNIIINNEIQIKQKENGKMKFDEQIEKDKIDDMEKYKKNSNEIILYKQIIECENLLKPSRKENNLEQNKSANTNLLLIIGKIESNLKTKIKNEILIIIYTVFQKSIYREAEKIFTEMYLEKF